MPIDSLYSYTNDRFKMRHNISEQYDQIHILMISKLMLLSIIPKIMLILVSDKTPVCYAFTLLKFKKMKNIFRSHNCHITDSYKT